MMLNSPCAPVLDALCDLMDDYLERQRDLLAVCEAQGRAARTRNLAELHEMTTALETLLQESVQDEPRRVALIRQVVVHHPLPGGRATLSALIQAVPDPWRRRLHEFQTAMAAGIQRNRAVLADNARIIHKSRRRVQITLDQLLGKAPETSAYTSRGHEPTKRKEVALLDARG